MGLAAFGFICAAVLGLARMLDPKDAIGQPRRIGTHQQLGLPPCSFHRVTGRPCPSCGVTTSLSHLMRADLADAWRANPAGAILGCGLILVIPWCLAGAVASRAWGVQRLDVALIAGVITVVGLLLVVWVWRLIVGW